MAALSPLSPGLFPAAYDFGCIFHQQVGLRDKIEAHRPEEKEVVDMVYPWSGCDRYLQSEYSVLLTLGPTGQNVKVTQFLFALLIQALGLYANAMELFEGGRAGIYELSLCVYFAGLICSLPGLLLAFQHFEFLYRRTAKVKPWDSQCVRPGSRKKGD